MMEPKVFFIAIQFCTKIVRLRRVVLLQHPVFLIDLNTSRMVQIGCILILIIFK
ncbi:hypothetical protein ES703_49719 [subsurface metagenome]